MMETIVYTSCTGCWPYLSRYPISQTNVNCFITHKFCIIYILQIREGEIA